jgi:hypothetical protein
MVRVKKVHSNEITVLVEKALSESSKRANKNRAYVISTGCCPYHPDVKLEERAIESVGIWFRKILVCPECSDFRSIYRIELNKEERDNHVRKIRSVYCS